jgi:hypothetical protein
MTALLHFFGERNVPVHIWRPSSVSETEIEAVSHKNCECEWAREGKRTKGVKSALLGAIIIEFCGGAQFYEREIYSLEKI